MKIQPFLIGFTGVGLLTTAYLFFASPSDLMLRREVKDAESRHALCNDGSPAVYYFRPGIDDGATKWHVHLKGGGACADPETCAERMQTDPDLVSSNSYPESIRSGGIFSISAQKNPDFYDWNQVYVYYCSSDAWSGDAVREVDGRDFQFNGHAIVRAVIEDLSDADAFEHPLSEADILLFTGSSAGGSGVANNLDAVAAMLPDVATYGIVDSSWQDEFKSFDHPTYDMNPMQWRGSVWDESCVDAHPRDFWLCNEDSVLAPYLETPAFYYIDQIDNNRLKHMGITNRQDPEQAAWIQAYTDHLRTSLPQVLKVIFSPHQGPHTVLTGDRFFTTRVKGVTVREAVSQWLLDPEAVHHWIAD